jgi:multiple antibiotic resistance protein
MINAFIDQIIQSFIVIFIILDPFLSLATFISLTKGMPEKEKAKQAMLASGVAFGLLVLFLFSGNYILQAVNIDLSSLRVAGGVILLILGIQAVLGLEFAKKKKDYKVAAVVIGTPLLCGPGAITTIIIQSQQFISYIVPLIASFIACVITYFMLVFADKISKVLGERMVEVISRVLGLILAAISIEMMKNGIIGMIQEFKGKP